MSLRDLGLSDIRVSQLDELVSRLLPTLGPEQPPAVPSTWKTSHLSTNSFFHNKHGEQLGQQSWEKRQFKENSPVTYIIKSCSSFFFYTFCPHVRSEFDVQFVCLTGFSHRRTGVFGSQIFHRQYHSPVKDVCSQLQFLPGKKLTFYMCKRLEI